MRSSQMADRGLSHLEFLVREPRYSARNQFTTSLLSKNHDFLSL